MIHIRFLCHVKTFQWRLWSRCTTVSFQIQVQMSPANFSQIQVLSPHIKESIKSDRHNWPSVAPLICHTPQWENNDLPWDTSDDRKTHVGVQEIKVREDSVHLFHFLNSIIASIMGRFSSKDAIFSVLSPGYYVHYRMIRTTWVHPCESDQMCTGKISWWYGYLVYASETCQTIIGEIGVSVVPQAWFIKSYRYHFTKPFRK